MKIKENIVIIISAIIVLFSVCIDLMPNMQLDTKFKLVIYIFSMIIVWIDMKLKNRKIIKGIYLENNRKKYLTVIFIIYTILIMTLLFLDTNYGRYNYTQNIKFLSKEHFNYYSNFIPFKTIYGYIKRFNMINTSIIVTNLLGNIIAFAPYGILVPIIFKEKFNNIKSFALLMVVIVLAVECIQFVTKRGSFDIDDLILNVLGAVMFFEIMKFEPIKKFVNEIIK